MFKIKTQFYLLLIYLISFFLFVNTVNITDKVKLSTFFSPSSNAIAIPPAQSPLSFMISNGIGNTNNNNNNVLSSPTVKYEAYKALAGETVRLECPQPNPTWFFRRLNKDNSNSNNVEDLIVTRHGIINADYKYKIMCHVTLKHQVIIINNIDFDEEGLYTCLYTQPNLEPAFKSGQVMHSNDKSPIQYRYVFNVTVYSKLSS